MAKNEFVAIINNIQGLIDKTEFAQIEIARQCLASTLDDIPKPAWNTGQLRTSGTAYLGGKMVARNRLHQPNPKGMFKGAQVRGKAGVAVARPGSVNIGMFNREGVSAGGGLPSTLKGAITIVYTSPVAAMMHEWKGGFSDSESGRFYLTSKFPKFGLIFASVMKKVW